MIAGSFETDPRRLVACREFVIPNSGGRSFLCTTTIGSEGLLVPYRPSTDFTRLRGTRTSMDRYPWDMALAGPRPLVGIRSPSGERQRSHARARPLRIRKTIRAMRGSLRREERSGRRRRRRRIFTGKRAIARRSHAADEPPCTELENRLGRSCPPVHCPLRRRGPAQSRLRASARAVELNCPDSTAGNHHRRSRERDSQKFAGEVSAPLLTNLRCMILRRWSVGKPLMRLPARMDGFMEQG